MKLFKILFLAMITVGIASCGGDDDAGSARFELNNTNLAGSYDLTFFRDETRETQDVNGTDIVTDIVVTGSTFTNAAFTFNATNNFSTSGRYVEETVTRVQGGTPRTDTEIVDLGFGGNYQLNSMNSMISLTDDFGDLITGTISNFTETGFKVVFNVTENDTDFTSTSTIEYRFTRQ